MRLPLPTALTALLLSSLPCAQARAERFDAFVLVPEVRQHHSFASGEGIAPETTDLVLAHGFGASGNHSELIARAGLRLTAGRLEPVAIPVALSWQVVPSDWVVAPLLGLEFGGAVSRAYADPFKRGEITWGWAWSLRGLLGAQVSIWKWVGVRVFVDADWNQVFSAAPGLATPGSGWGWGLGLSFRRGLPRHTLVDMLTEGSGLPGDL